MARWVRRLRFSRRTVAAVVLVMAGVAGLTAFGVGAGDDNPSVSQARITITPPAESTADVSAGSSAALSRPLSVTVTGGALLRVRVADQAGRPVAGRVAPGGRSWRSVGPLSRGARYTVDALARDVDGRRAARHAVVTVPEEFIGRYNTGQDQTVGTGMIISVQFSRPIADRAAVQRAVTAIARPAVRVAPHWFGAQRLDLRPEHFWKPGTRVTLSLRLRGVEGSPGVYGTQDEDVDFLIGREQTSTVDADGHTLTVRQGDRVVRTLPVSTGSGDHPTYAGTMVISEKHQILRMNGQTVGYGGQYDIADVPHAMRLTDSGTFVHGNYWSDESVFGSDNTSHGCIGLQDVKGGGDGRTPAAWFYDDSLIGDIVDVAGSNAPALHPDNGLSGWNMPWRQWLENPA